MKSICRTFLITLIFFSIEIAPALSNDEKHIEIILNQIRIKNNKLPLKKSEPLMAAAQAHAKDMRYKNYFSHIDKNGSDHNKRIKRAGYTTCYSAENIAKGQKTPSKVMADWMRSKGHRYNILNNKPTHYGLGISGNIWVMVFAKDC